MASNPRQITSADFFSFFMPEKSFNKPLEFLLLKQIDYFFLHEKCAGVYKGIPMVYFGGYMYQQYIYSVVI